MGTQIVLLYGSYVYHYMNETHKLTTISITRQNYEALRELGKTGDSFKDILTKLLETK